MNAPSPGTAGSSAAVWDRQSATYDAERSADPVYRSCAQLAAAALPVTRIALDAGYGTGWTTSELRERSDLVVAVDYSIESLRALRRRAIDGVLVVQADVRQLPFADATFEASLCANTLQHLASGIPQRSAVDELRRVTRDDGAVAISVHHYSRAKRRKGWIKEGKPGQPGIDYIFRFTRDDLLRLVPGARPRAIGHYGLCRIPGAGARLQRAAGRFLGRLAAPAAGTCYWSSFAAAGDTEPATARDCTRSAPRITSQVATSSPGASA